MLGLSFGEILVVGVIALLVVGPDRLPQFARSAGKMYGQFRRTADELRQALVLEADRQDADERLSELKERRRRAEEQRQKAEGASPGVQAQPDPHAPPPEQDDEVDPEYAAFVEAASGPYAAGRSLDEVVESWNQAPRITETDRPPLPEAPPADLPEQLPPGISAQEWRELPPHIKALLVEQSRSTHE